ncbi:acyl-coenzyme A synthetase/AMP-(fatty) acid ligase [Streptosporangium album]|uniref:Acyl-coenzyme A synthetase/AMP-(Fatty) acid ligase n=1 Tax=Streptosporangium album TaxID=47479 RepID=A0A7W7S5U9_9ACTN|nr:AMP-binding protein [Streptosporangium album]MBB4944047.1 acyl-coenzyme A synthetase/AMP-(fatty) acid ligase [Streptosporangium album]
MGVAHANSGSGVRPGTLIHSLLDEAAAEASSASAVRDATGAWNYARLAAYSHAVGAWLYAQGVERGDRVLVQLPSNRETVALFYGVSRRGAIFVPINPAMKAFHLRAVIDNADPKLIITVGDRVAALAELTSVPVHAIESVWAEVENLATLGVGAEPAEVVPDDVGVLVYTSGSTAVPKAVVCPHAQVTFATRAINEVLAYRPDDVVFCRFPLSWDYGLYKVLLTCVGRSEIVLADGESDLVLFRRMRETGATVVPIVPSLATMIATLARRETEPPPPVRMFTNTGAALPPSTIEALRAAFPGVRVVRQFGQTECKRISIMPPELDGERPDSVGRPLPGTGVLILDDAGQPVPTGQVGEIVAVGPHVMPGYWRTPEVTARAFRRDERTGEPRLHTGDYGSLDEDGYLYFEGRRDDMFKRKGIRMSTLEIEAAAMDLPGVRAAAVLPPTAQRDLALCVETELAPHVVLRELSRRLEAAKVPALCRTVTDLPLTLHGKNERAKLAELFDGSLR